MTGRRRRYKSNEYRGLESPMERQVEIENSHDNSKNVEQVLGIGFAKFSGVRGKVIHHYTQLVWAKTDHVGCALTFYKNSTRWNFHLMACNYAPMGNYKYFSVYKQGTPASDCGKLPVNKKYPGLCGPDNL
ncbi:scoloptoxin SSD976-like [Diabrotica undecimpunctata]|uniref:scoloptoxin SSD976-like n=1 Tax=Diabrotica undecimpunctata TaxID=50387 RepID=UPI003B6420D1